MHGGDGPGGLMHSDPAWMKHVATKKGTVTWSPDFDFGKKKQRAEWFPPHPED